MEEKRMKGKNGAAKIPTERQERPLTRRQRRREGGGKTKGGRV